VAGNIAKKASHHQGVFLMDTPALQTAALEATAVEDIWGIGRNMAPKLRTWGIGNARQLRDVDIKAYRAKTNVVGEQLVYELRGVLCYPLGGEPTPRRSIICSRSFGQKVTTLSDLKEAVAYHAAQAALKLRHDGGHARGIAVFVKSHLDLPSFSLHTTLPCATDFTPDLIAAAQLLLDELFQPGLRYKKAGVMLFDIHPGAYQGSLFVDGPSPRQQKMMAMLDQANRRWGKDFLRFAATGIKRPWQSKIVQRSPRYTTHFTELLKVS
jgi:DNA polymerase V